MLIIYISFVFIFVLFYFCFQQQLTLEIIELSVKRAINVTIPRYPLAYPRVPMLLTNKYPCGGNLCIKAFKFLMKI